MNDTPGNLSARYQILRELGSGGMGRVYEALQVGLDRRVAIKVLKPERFHDEEGRKRFVEEARILARLSHPNIVVLYDADLEGGVPFIAMEFVEGVSLQRLIHERKTLSTDEVLRILHRILGGLAYLHGSGVIHRDLKPENILMAAGRTPKLLDFGLARTQDTERLTAAGFTVGTPMYMAPEQMLGREPGPAADLYSLGMVVYLALVGEHPFSESNFTQLLQQKLALNPERIASKLAGFPKGLVDITVRCLSSSPDERFESASAMRSALITVLSGRSHALAASTAEAPASAPAAKLVAPLVVLGGVLALGLAVMAHRAFQPPMSQRAQYAPFSLETQPRQGGCIVRWSSQKPYPSRVIVAGTTHGEGGPTTDHEVLVYPVPWASPPEARILLPDESTPAAFMLEAEPVPVTPTVQRSGADWAFSLSLPVVSSASLLLEQQGRPVQTVQLPRSDVLRCRLTTPDPTSDYTLRVKLEARGILPVELAPIPLPGLTASVNRLIEEIRSLPSKPFIEELDDAASRGLPPEGIREQLERLLERIQWRSRFDEIVLLAQWGLGPENEDLVQKARLVRCLEVLARLELVALNYEVDFTTGVREVLGNRWASFEAPPPEGGRTYPRLLPTPTKIVGQFTSILTQVAFDEKYPLYLDFAFDLTDLDRLTQAYVSVEVQHMRYDGLLHVMINPAGQKSDSLWVDLTYPHSKATEEKLILTHGFDPAFLKEGKNLIRVRFGTLPRGIATFAMLHSLSLTLQ